MVAGKRGKLVLVLAVLAIALSGCTTSSGQDGQSGGNTQPEIQGQNGNETGGSVNTETSAGPSSNPEDYAVRQRYFQEAFQPDRESYKLFEKAAAFLKRPVSEMPNYFSLNSEREIFAELPDVPKDFSEVAFLLASGELYAIGGFSGNYYKQPEFYPGFKETGLKYWTEPDPKYWVPNGYGVYPAEQFDTLSLSGRNEFTAVAFFYSGYGVQTYQGVTIVPSSDSLKYFDITVTPDTFLLTPTFPKFTDGWAERIEITGKAKPGTPPGEYELGFIVVAPPKEKKDEWKFKYRNIYFDAASGVAPSGAPIKFTIKVEE